MNDLITTTAQQDEVTDSQEREVAEHAQQTVDESTENNFSETAEDSRGTDKPQGKAENARQAQKRRDGERQRVAREAREAGIIEAIRGTNPFTGAPVKDSRDIEEYLLMKEISDKGGDPLGDFYKHRKDKDKQADEAAAEEAREREWIEDDRESFISKYPDVDLNGLIEDEDFRLFAEGKVGNVPLADIYGSYVSFRDKFEKQAKNRAAQMYANHKASPGALASSEQSDGSYYTPEQVRAMTPEAVHENYERITESMKRWK